MTTTVIGDNTGYEIGVVDNGIIGGSPTTNNETGYLYVSTTGSVHNRTLFKFTGLANITGPVTVSSAVLTLMTADTNATRAVSLRKLLVPFDEATSTWNLRSTGNSWGTAGASGAGDTDPTVVATGTIPATNGTAFNISGAGFNALVEGWINGTITNNGCILSCTDETTASYAYLLRQSEDATPSRRPYLTVTYTASGATISTITGTTATEGSSIVFTATMSGTGGGTFAYSWLGTATSPDYTSTLTNDMFTVTGGSGNVTVSGSNITVDSTVTAFTVTVPTTSDTLDEADETIRLVIGGVTSSSGTITDDDPLPSISINDVSQSGSTYTFTITLSAASGRTVTVDYATANGAKVDGVDFTGVTGTATFAPGETSKTVSVSVL